MFLQIHWSPTIRLTEEHIPSLWKSHLFLFCHWLDVTEKLLSSLFCEPEPLHKPSEGNLGGKETSPLTHGQYCCGVMADPSTASSWTGKVLRNVIISEPKLRYTSISIGVRLPFFIPCYKRKLGNHRAMKTVNSVTGFGASSRKCTGKSRLMCKASHNQREAESCKNASTKKTD